MKALLLIAFTTWLVFSGALFFSIYLTIKKKAKRLHLMTLYMLTPISALITFIYTFDVVQVIAGNTVIKSGNCILEFDNADGDTEITYIVLENELYKVHGDEYSNLEDGEYYCEVEASPITYTVVKSYIKMTK